ncbi:DUF3618 domain-containing protein [Nakamurella aerolata]|uniref:DUF3618 domain-containing protein n=1 Tax=Nakamurella aerolata TaxID=1656892 RepID=A0A849ADI9_9ACTN|nr:DUF3618 domain-containing protein [Nakamurella aerolata]
MARDVETIQAEIDRARNALAVAVDEISDRANPKALAERGKQTAVATLNDPKVKFPLIGVGVLILLLIIRKIFR